MFYLGTKGVDLYYYRNIDIIIGENERPYLLILNYFCDKNTK